MVTYQPEEKTRIKRQKEEQAVQLAMQSRWDEAVAVNQFIIELFPNDVDAFNRLGKALTELGKFTAARAAYARSLEISPSNSIARKNHQRLAGLKEAAVANEAPVNKVDPRLFIEERGKTAVVSLRQPGPKATLALVNAGDVVNLRQDGRSLVVETARGDYLGKVEPKLAVRVVKMMEGGNKYAAAVTSVGDGGVKIILREVFQSPIMAGQVSFPGAGDLGVRPYTRESLLKYGYDDDDDLGGDDDDRWEDEGRRSWSNADDDFSMEDTSPLPDDDDRDNDDDE